MDAFKCSMEGHQFNCHEDKTHSTPCAGWMAMRFKNPVTAPWPFSYGEKNERAVEVKAVCAGADAAMRNIMEYLA